MPSTPDDKELLRLKSKIVTKFTEENWLEIGLLTDSSNIIQGHNRLLRSLGWGDADYAGNALDVLISIVRNSPDNLKVIGEYVDSKYVDDETFISSKPNIKRITFAPNVFEIPDVAINDHLVSVMMPFAKEFSEVYEAIKQACANADFDCKRADDIWEHSVLIQDIFRLIFTSRIVISDFSRRNPNVMYETGIAHTLGKTVLPITQDSRDVPFDIAHHRVLAYLPNSEGLGKLTSDLTKRLKSI